MIVIAKSIKKESFIEWIYPSLDESLHNGSQVSGYELRKRGYHFIGRTRFVLDTTFNGDMNGSYRILESSIKPKLRDKIISEIIYNE